MRTSRIAIAAVAILALAGCGSAKDPQTAAEEKKSERSPLAEYMGDGFAGSVGSGISLRAEAQRPSEEELAIQRKEEDTIAACMKAAGFQYVAAPPETQAMGRFDEAFKLAPNKFAHQYGYGITTIDWSKSGAEDNDPNAKIRNRLSAQAKKEYELALNGPAATTGAGGMIVLRDGKATVVDQNSGCRAKATEVRGKDKDQVAAVENHKALLDDIEALQKRIETSQHVHDATTAWGDCLADAGYANLKAIEEPRQKVSQKLDELAGAGGTNDGNMIQLPSFDKVNAAKLSELRKFEIALAVADQGCRVKMYDEPYKKVRYELEKEFVAEHKAELEAYREATANR